MVPTIRALQYGQQRTFDEHALQQTKCLQGKNTLFTSLLIHTQQVSLVR